MKPDYVTVSLSGGKDSTAMLLRMMEIGEPIHEVMFCDTGLEFPEMYVHINQLKTEVEKAGIKFTTLKNPLGFEYYLMEVNVKGRCKKGYGRPSSKKRWCTKYLKTSLIDKHLKSLKKEHNVIQCVGLAADEGDRLNRKQNNQINHRHPLVEWGWTEAQALDYCYKRGYDWGGLYRLFDRVSCWCCPLQPLKELYKLWENYPGLWGTLQKWQGQIDADYGVGAYKFIASRSSVFDLEKRFEIEQRRRKNGLRNTANFYREVKQSIRPDPSQTSLLFFEEGGL